MQRSDKTAIMYLVTLHTVST